MANVSLHPLARHEYRTAVGWYRDRSYRAAERFVAEVERVLAEIAARPERYGWYDDEFREAPLRRYPYSVIYRLSTTGPVLVAAIAHASREPGYWQDRA